MATSARSLRDRAIDISVQVLDFLTAEYPHRNFAIQFWNGELWGDETHPRFTMVLKHPGALRQMLLGASQLSLGEAYIFDDFDVVGSLEAAIEFGDWLIAHHLELGEKLRLAGLLLKLPHNGHQASPYAPHLHGSAHSKARDREAVTYHYDLSNDFYSLWLDRRMVYSCGYYRRGDESIDEAQENKLDYLCRKLRLCPGERLLDVGCGWGGLIVHAAQRFGVKALGITLSERQAEVARVRIEEAGVADRCQVQVRDYRDLDPTFPFDKIVSVGMFEHVGESQLPDYFQKVRELLKNGGVFLNHGIAVSAKYRRRGASFIDKYVFPDGGLVPISTTTRIAEACGFEVRDVENLREHYARTLRSWVQRLEDRAEEARRITNEAVYRIWRIYMAGCAHAFAIGRVNLYQVLFSKAENGETGLPLTRADWYV